MDKAKLDFLTQNARKIRDDAIEIIGRFGSGHIGGAMSVIDALTVIYYDKANIFNIERYRRKYKLSN